MSCLTSEIYHLYALIIPILMYMEFFITCEHEVFHQNNSLYADAIL